MNKNIKIFMAFVLLLMLSCSAYAESYAEGEAIVVFKSAEVVNSSVAVAGASVSDTYEALSQAAGKTFVRVKSDTKTTEELIAEFKNMPNVIAVSPNRIHHMPFSFSSAENVTPNDPSYGKLWNLERINAPKAWEETTGSDTVYVAVIDSGVYYHDDLKDNIDVDLSAGFNSHLDWDNDIIGHGTHIAGTIGAVGNNNTGIAGVNWKVKIISLNVTSSNGEDADDETIINALNYLTGLLNNNPTMNLAAVNVSLGDYYPKTPEEMKNDAYYLAFKALNDLNRTLIIVAAGNEGLEVGEPAQFDDPLGNNEYGFAFRKNYYTYPASFTGLDNMIVVGATDQNNDAPGFTNWGNNVDIAAPGDGIYSTYSYLAEDEEGNTGTLYTELSGTSMAAPHVTGAAALLAAAVPTASPAQIKKAITSSANKRINPIVYPYENQVKDLGLDEDDTLLPYKIFDGKYQVSNYGMLDVYGAMSAITGRRYASSSTSSNSSSSGGCSLGLGYAAMLVCVLLCGRKKS